MNKNQNSPMRRPLVAAMAMALALPGIAFAQTDKERELEARIAELERIVQQLSQQQAAQPAAAPAEANPIQRRAITGGSAPGTVFGYGGFIKANTTYSDYTDGNPAAGSVGRDFYLPGAIPVQGAGPSLGTDGVWDAHAKQSRFWLTTDTTLDNGAKLGTRLEMDFAVPVGGNERSTNTYNPVIRRAYFTYNNWLFGQEWSNFMELGALPETTDFIGPSEGVVFVRQPQIRYTNGPWSVSIENPETTLMPFGGGAYFDTDQNSMPDITARWRHTADWGFFSLAGLARQLKREVANGPSDDEIGLGISATARINMGANDIRMMATYGQGIGRYTGLGFFADGVLDATGRIEPLDVFAAYAAYRHVWTGTFRSNFIVGFTKTDNPVALTGTNVNEQAQSFRVNLMWSPQPRLDFGVELSTAKRQLENERFGELTRLDFMGRYTF